MGFCLNRVVALSIQGQQPILGWKSWSNQGKIRLKGQSGLYGINLKTVDGPHVNTASNPILADNHTSQNLSPTDSDWHIEVAVFCNAEWLVPKTQEVWLGAVKQTWGSLQWHHSQRGKTADVYSLRTWSHWEAALQKAPYVYMQAHVYGVLCNKVEQLLWFLWVGVSQVCAT